MNISHSLFTVPWLWLGAAVRAPFTRPTAVRAFREIDTLRGIAIILVVVYHFIYDLCFFGISDAVFTKFCHSQSEIKVRHRSLLGQCIR